MDWIGLDWIGLDWIGLDWIGLVGCINIINVSVTHHSIGLDWLALDWIGLDWLGCFAIINVTYHSIGLACIGYFNIMSCVRFDPDNRGEFTELSNNNMTLRRTQSYWYGSAWSPRPLPLRTIVIDHRFEAAFGFSVIVRELCSRKYSGSLKLGLTTHPLDEPLQRRHIRGLQRSVVVDFDTSIYRASCTRDTPDEVLRIFAGQLEQPLQPDDLVSVYYIPDEHMFVLMLNDDVLDRDDCVAKECIELEGAIDETSFYPLVEVPTTSVLSLERVTIR